MVAYCSQNCARVSPCSAKSAHFSRYFLLCLVERTSYDDIAQLGGDDCKVTGATALYVLIEYGRCAFVMSLCDGMLRAGYHDVVSRKTGWLLSLFFSSALDVRIATMACASLLSG